MLRDALGKDNFTPIQRNNRIESINNSNKIKLENLTDEQKALLTKLSYLDINTYDFEVLQKLNKKITISDLDDLLKSPDESYLGELNITDLTKNVTGVDISSKQLIEELEKAGLGNLTIVDIANNPESGFQAICFSDDFTNKGFSFRGTDIKDFSSLTKDSLTDIQSFLFGNCTQLNEAMDFFDNNSNNSESNYLYGHSLGGFLSENVFAKNHQNVANTFVINPLHLDSDCLQSDGVIKAFNNSEKFSCHVTGGDYVSQINQPSKFENNINYIKNNQSTHNNIFGNHLIESASFNQSGNFIPTTKDDAFKNYSPEIANSILGILNNNPIKKGIDLGQNVQKKGTDLRQKAQNLLKNITNSFNRKLSSTRTDTKISNTYYETNNQPSQSQLFRDRINLKNWISDSYSVEDYNSAIEFFKNPTKYIKPLSVTNPNPNRGENTNERVPWGNLERI